MTPEPSTKRIYVREAAELLGREMGTLRKWESEGVLPPKLRSHRGERNWRYWTPDQIDGIRKWIAETDRRPGKGLPHYHPEEEKVQETIKKLRRPRRSTILKLESEGVLPKHLHHTKDARGRASWTDEQMDEIVGIIKNTDAPQQSEKPPTKAKRPAPSRKAA